MTAEREKRLIETLGGMCVAAAMVVRDAAKSREMPSREDCAREFNDAVLGAAKPIMEMFAADRAELDALRAALVGAEEFIARLDPDDRVVQCLWCGLATVIEDVTTLNFLREHAAICAKHPAVLALVAAESRAQRAEADRERLDWLEANACELNAHGDVEGGYWTVITNKGHAYVSSHSEENRHTPRAAIDAARAAP